MIRLRKSMAILTVLLMLSVVFISGCGAEKTGSPTSATSQQAATTTSVQAEKPMELVWLGTNPNGVPLKENSETALYLEKKFNVEIKVTNVDQFNEESWNLFWASGNTADLVYINGARRASALINQGLIRPIPEDMLRKHMPKWMEKVESLVDPEIVRKQITVDGKIYYAPYQNYTVKMTYVAGIRQDWMENVGITKVPETIDEFTELLKRFTLNDPDKNGKNDTYGMESEPWNRFSYVFGAFGTNYDSYYLDNSNKVYYTPASENYKKMLKQLNAWYKAGYIDPEFITDLRPAVWNKFAESKFGVMFDHTSWFFSSKASGPAGLLAQKNPNAKLVYAPAFTGPDGFSGGSSGFPSVIHNALCFGSKTSDEKVIKIMEMFEINCTDWDHYLKVQYGDLGKTFEIKDGVPQLLVDYSKSDNMAEYGLGQTYGLRPITTEELMTKLSSPKDKGIIELGSSNKPAYMGQAFVFSGVNESFSNNGADLKKVSDEFYYNAISGKYDIDKEWDLYVKKLEAAGMTEVCNGFQKLYDKSNR